MLEVKPLATWSAENADVVEPADKLKKYSDYLQTEYFKAGALDAERMQGIALGARDFAVANGLVSADLPDEEQVKGAVSLLAPRQNVDADAKLLFDYYDNAYRGDLSEEDQADAKANAEGLREYLLYKKVAPEKVSEVEGFVLPLLSDPEKVARARNAALNRGDVGLVAYTKADGTRDLRVGGSFDPATVNETIGSLLGSGAIDASDLPQVKGMLRKVNGDKATVAEINRSADMQRSISALVEKDADLKSSLQTDVAQLRLAQTNAGKSGAELVTKALLEVPVGAASAVAGAVTGIFSDEEASKKPAKTLDLLLGNQALLDAGYTEKEIRRYGQDFLQLQAGPAYRADKPESGIGTDSLGNVMVAPLLVPNKALFDASLKAAPLSEDQKAQAVLRRDNALTAGSKGYLRQIVENDDDAVTAYAAAKAKGETDEQFIEKWVAEKGANYSGMFERTQQLGMLGVELVGQVFLGVPAMMGSETATKALTRISKDRSDRQEYMRLMGDELGLMYQLVEAIPQVAADIYLTAGTAGGYTALKTAIRGGTKAVLRKAAANALTLADEPTKLLISNAMKAENVASMGKALKEFGTKVAPLVTKVEQAAPLFATSFYRSATSNYVSFYGQLPETQTHAEKHRNALGYAIGAGLSTGALTVGMGFLGRGGVEDLASRVFKPLKAGETAAAGQRVIPLHELNYKQAKLAHEALYNAGREVTDTQFKQALRVNIGGAYKNYLRTAYKGFIDEGTEEALDQFITAKIEDAAVKKTTPIAELADQVWSSFVLGGILGSGASTIQQLAPLSLSERGVALRSSIATGTRMANNLRNTGSPEVAAFFERNLEQESIELRSEESKALAARARAEARKADDTEGFTEDVPLTFDDEGQAVMDLGVEPTEPTLRVVDLIGERVHAAGYSGILTRDENGALFLQLGKTTKGGIERVNLGATLTQKAADAGILRRTPLMSLAAAAGDIPAGTPYVIPDPRKKNPNRFALIKGADNFVFTRDEKGALVLTVRNAPLIGAATAVSSDVKITDPSQINNIVKRFGLSVPDVQDTALDIDELPLFTAAADTEPEPVVARATESELVEEQQLQDQLQADPMGSFVFGLLSKPKGPTVADLRSLNDFTPEQMDALDVQLTALEDRAESLEPTSYLKQKLSALASGMRSVMAAPTPEPTTRSRPAPLTDLEKSAVADALKIFGSDPLATTIIKRLRNKKGLRDQEYAMLAEATEEQLASLQDRIDALATFGNELTPEGNERVKSSILTTVNGFERILRKAAERKEASAAAPAAVYEAPTFDLTEDEAYNEAAAFAGTLDADLESKALLADALADSYDGYDFAEIGAQELIDYAATIYSGPPDQKNALLQRLTDKDPARAAAITRSLAATEQAVLLSRSAANVQAAGFARSANSSEANRLGLVSGDPNTVIEALRKIAVSGNAVHERVAAMLLPYSNLISNVNFVVKDFDDVRFAGAYLRESNLLVLNLSGHSGRGLSDTLLHELIHAVSTNVILNPQTPAQRAAVTRIGQLRVLTETRMRALGKPTAQWADALANNDEFVAYGLTDPAFQQLIKDSTPLEQRSLFTRFVESILEIFGVSPKDTTTVDPVSELLDFTNMIASDMTYSMSTDRRLRNPVRDTEAGIAALNEFLSKEGNLASTYAGVRLGAADTDAAYLELAKDPIKNRVELERLVDEAAKSAGYTVGPVYHGSYALSDKLDGVFPDKKLREFRNQPDISTSDLFHFGTKEQAERRRALAKIPFTEEELDAIEEAGAIKNSGDWPSLWSVKPFYLRGNFQSASDVDAQLKSNIPDGVEGFVYQNEVEGLNKDLSYAVKDARDIKSADPVTYDDNGNVIPLSQRFDLQSNDIRFSLGTALPLPVEGAPYEANAYHGGALQVAADIKPSTEGALGNGYYLTTAAGAAQYVQESGSTFQKNKNGKVHGYAVRLNNPLIIDRSSEEGRNLPDPLAMAFIKLGMSRDKALALSEKINDEKGYPSKELSSRGIKLGYDGIVLIAPNGEVTEVVAWQKGALNPLPPVTDDIRFSLGATDIEGEPAEDPVSAFRKLVPEGFTVVAHESLTGEAAIRRSRPDVIFVNPALLANRLAGLNARAQQASLRALVDHELGHLAVATEFADEDVARIAKDLGDDRLNEIAYDYYSATGLSYKDIKERVAADRASGQLSDADIADEWLRMQVTKAALGRTYEEDLRYVRQNPTLLDSFIRALQAFAGRLSQRFAAYPTAETAAAVSRAERTLRKMRALSAPAGNDVGVEYKTFGDAQLFLDAIDGSPQGDRTLYSIPVVDNNGKTEKFMGDLALKLKLYNLPTILRQVQNNRSAAVNSMSLTMKNFIRAFPKLRDEALRKGATIEDIGILLGTTAPPITKADEAEITKQLDIFANGLDPALTTKKRAEAIENKKQALETATRNRFSNAFRRKQVATEAFMRDAGFGKLVDQVVAVRKDINVRKEALGLDASNDVYLTRAYRFFTTKGWADAAKQGKIIKVDGKEVNFYQLRELAAAAYRDQADAYLAKVGKPYSEEDVSNKTIDMLDQYLATLEKHHSAVDAATVNSLKEDLNRFKPKKDIEGSFRALLGEIEDPMANAINTFYRVGMLSANREFRESFTREAIALNLAARKPLNEDWVLLYPASASATVGPLAGLYMEKQTAAAFMEVYGRNSIAADANAAQVLNKAGRIVGRVTGLAVLNATQLGFGYWPRNVIGGIMQGAAQGIFFTKDTVQSGIDSWRTAFSLLPTDEDQRKALLRLTELGVLSEQSSGRVVQDLARGVVALPEESLQELMADMEEARLTGDAGGMLARIKEKGVYKGIYDVLGKGYLKTTDFLAALDAVIDGTFKTNAYYFELDAIEKHYGDRKSTEEKEALAAHKVKLTFAGHSQVIDLVKSFSRSPASTAVVPFARWKSEVARTMLNTIPLALSEIKEGGSMSVRGMRRLLGFGATLAAAPAVIGAIATAVFRLLTDDDEEEVRELTLEERTAHRETLPLWQRGHNLYSRLMKNGEIQFIDMTYVLPHSPLTDLVSIAVDGIKTGKGLDASRLVSYVASELIGLQIAATSIAEAVSGENDFGQPIYVESDPDGVKVERIFKHLAKGIVVPSGIKKGIDIGREGQQNAQELLYGELLGVRPRSNKISELERRGYKNLDRLMREAKSIRAEFLGSRFISDEDIDAGVDRAQYAENEAQRRITNFTSAMLSLGSSTGTLVSSAKAAGLDNEEIVGAITGFRNSITFTEDFLNKAYESAQRGEEQDPLAKVQSLIRSTQRNPDGYYVNASASPE